ncbi:MAG TPA: VOC family protein [Candidatus Dormibacteraeota bacterium]
MPRLGMVTIVVPDYDAAIRFYVEVMGFTLLEDTPLGESKRWVVVAPDPESGATLLVAKAAGPAQESSIGNQTGGRVAFFLYTDDLDAYLARLAERGVVAEAPVRTEDYGRVTVIRDLYGNRWDVIER